MFSAAFVLTIASSVMAVGPLPPLPAGGGADADAVTVLDSNSLWRHFVVSRCTFARTPDGKLEPWDWTPLVRVYVWPATRPKPAVSTESSPLPPANWAGLDMDDGAWPRVRLPQPPTGPPAEMSRPQTKVGAYAALFLRGKFEVKDPARVNACRLALDYLGGVVVYLNGKEVVRRHVPAGKRGQSPFVRSTLRAVPANGDCPLFPDPLALAEDYPAEAFIKPKGGFAFYPGGRTAFGPELPDWSASGAMSTSAGGTLRDRHLRDFAIPTTLLRRGVNVLAVEVHVSPLALDYVKEMCKQAAGEQGAVPWMPIGLLRARLTVSPGTAAVSNVARPKGIQVWNCAPYDTLGVFDFGDPAEPPRPVVIHAARNSAFSGRLVVSSDQPIQGLKVAVSDLIGAGARLPASAVRVRYAVAVVPGELPPNADRNWKLSQGKSYLPADRFDGLLDAIPAEIPVSQAPAAREKYYGRPVDRTGLVAGAVAPLWFTVQVPKDANPGVYQGQIAIEAEGLPATKVPLRVSVCDWAMPNPEDFRLCNLPCQYDWPLAWHYGVPLWSDKHFDLIGKAHALMGQAASRQFCVDLIVPPEMDPRSRPAVPGPGDFGESIIRWIKQPDGSLKHDMTAFDKYLDMVARSVVRPRPLRLRAWVESRAMGPDPGVKRHGNTHRPEVSVVDPATGKIERMKTPDPATDGAAAVAFWRPVFDDVLKRVKDRGWLDAAALGWSAFYGGPDDDVAKLAKQLWPDAVWALMNHEANRDWRDRDNPWVKLRYACTCYNLGFPAVRGYRALLEPRPVLLADVFRANWRDYSPLTHQRRTGEDIAMSGVDGVSDFGADLFTYRRPNGEISVPSVSDNRPAGPGQTQMCMLYPGPDGPVTTERLETVREGVELTEALLFIERAIQEKKLSPALQERAEKALEARSHAFIMDWFAIRDMPAEEDGKLLDLAGEVAKEVDNRANSAKR